MNRYAYCGGNPISYVDPEGEFAESVVGWYNGLSPAQKIIMGTCFAVVGTGLVVISGGSAAPAIAGTVTVLVEGAALGAAENVVMYSLGTMITGEELTLSGIGQAAYSGAANGVFSAGIGVAASGIGYSVGSAMSKSGTKGNITQQYSNNKIQSASEEAIEWLGADAKVITNSNGDKVFISEDGLRKIRFDINNTSPHNSPHMHIEKSVNGRWKPVDLNNKQIYPIDVPKN